MLSSYESIRRFGFRVQAQADILTEGCVCEEGGAAARDGAGERRGGLGWHLDFRP